MPTSPRHGAHVRCFHILSFIAAAAACGRADGQATATQAQLTTDVQGATSDADAQAGDGVDEGSAAESADGDASAVNCYTLQERAEAAIDKALAHTRACTEDADCMVVAYTSFCYAACGYHAAVSDDSAIEAAVAEVRAELCPAQCGYLPPPSCVGHDTYAAECDGGQCRLAN